MTHPAAIVIGPGRSGTSTVARILHEQLGVCMGHYLKMQLPGGAYEDYLAHGLTRMLVADALTAEEWLRVMSESHGHHSWGAKDPWFLYWSVGQLKQLDPGLVIRTWRSRDQVVRSWLHLRARCDRKEPPPQAAAHFERLWDDRERRADQVEANSFNVLRISFDEQRTDGEVVTAIRECL